VSCRLCGLDAPLKDSHGIPAFVARWLKATSATGYLRSYQFPNRRVQDLRTEHLLCQSCERRFSVAEGEFARRLFLLYHEGRSRFEYQSWLLYFAVSLAWRCAITSKREELEKYPQHVEAVDNARQRWADFLLDKVGTVTPYRFNLFFTPAGVRSETRIPEGLSWYFLRAVDMTPVYSRSKVAMYVKLPGMFFWTCVVPPDPGGWRGTRIAKHGMFRAKNQVLADNRAGAFLIDRAEAIDKRFDTISPAQQQRIERAALNNPERAAESKSFEAWLDRERIREENLRNT